MKITLRFLIALLISCATFVASAQSTLSFNHPKDQIALQLGAIQMGYTMPFQLVSGNATKAQQAANALVMGRNALDATVAKPAVKVQGFVNSPAVDTVEYRDQLYQAVEAVVTSPVVGSIRGTVTVVGSSKKVSVSAVITLPPNAYTIPVPYALEAATSVDAQALRDELVAAGVLTAVGGGTAGGGGNATAEMISVQGGTLPQSSGLAGQQVGTFQIGKYEVTWNEWVEVRTWAVANGYSDLANVGVGNAGNHPVNSLSWYDALKWCNAKSQKLGLTPVYKLNGAIYKTGEVAPSVDALANGYRLPTNAEWEWAARGGVSSQGYSFSGSNDVNAVAWYQNNSDGGTKAVGTKAANELGIYDMSGNLGEWCQDFVYNIYPYFRGGGWNRTSSYCAISKIAYDDDAADRGLNLGFRLARISEN
jgi:formylglycine-generating enzyme required for sulfatase activity